MEDARITLRDWEHIFGNRGFDMGIDQEAYDAAIKAVRTGLEYIESVDSAIDSFDSKDGQVEVKDTMELWTRWKEEMRTALELHDRAIGG